MSRDSKTICALLCLALASCQGALPVTQEAPRDATQTKRDAVKNVAKHDEAAAVVPVAVEIVCADHGERVPRAVPLGEIDRQAVDVVNRSVFWLVNKARCDNVNELAKMLAELALSGQQPVEVMVGPGTMWADVVQLYEQLAMRDFTEFRLPGDWKVHPYAVDLQPRPPSLDGRLVAPVIVTPWLPDSSEYVAELQVDQVGRVRLSGKVLLDPTSDMDRLRLRKAIAELGMRAVEQQETEEMR